VNPRVFVKTAGSGPAGLLAAEARGLGWLRVVGGPPLPDVLEISADRLVVSWIESGRPTAVAAADFGRRLATLHRSADEATYGAAEDGFIGPLPLDNTRHDDWPSFYAERRLAPYLPGLDADTRRAVATVIEHVADLAGPAEPPARIHGDLWSGNVLWGDDGQAWLVDASSAHNGHRETDLAMLTLFGAPFFDEILRAYDATAPLSAGWRDRAALHQLHPLLVHAQLFGGSYVDQVRAAARTLC
jgi:fructosamine-3-kinase